jgi:hypothetical protein
MINAIDNMLNEFESGITLNINKITAVTEAAERELEINFKKCDLKVMTENGTDEDLSMLYEAAKSANTESVTEAFKGFKNGVADAFNSLSKSASNTINTESNKETLSKLSEKIKFAPLLKKKEILSVDTSAIDKTANDALKELDGIKAKIKSGVGSPSAEITAVMSDFNKAIASVSDSANETKKKIESACSDCKSGMSKITSEVDSAKVKATSAVNEAIELVKAGADPALAREWANAKVEIIKASTTAKANGLKSDIKEIAAAIKAYKTVQKDMADEAKDDKAVKESAEDEATTTEEPAEETPEEVVSESTEDSAVTDVADNEVVEEAVDVTPDDGDDLSEPVSMDGYGAALNMADPASSDDIDAELASLEANTLTESEDWEYLDNMILELAINDIGGREAWDNYVTESGADTEYVAASEYLRTHDIGTENVTVESVYEELFGEPMVESEQDKLDLQNLFNDIFEEATKKPEKPSEETMGTLQGMMRDFARSDRAKQSTMKMSDFLDPKVQEEAHKQAEAMKKAEAANAVKEDAVEESVYDSLMNAILAL